MSVRKIDELLLYPEEYLIEESELPDSAPQSRLMIYLYNVLEYLYRYEKWMIALNRNVRHPEIRNRHHVIAPDIAVYKEIAISQSEQERMKTYNIQPPLRPAPPVVFEISSEETWQSDVGAADNQKIAIYGRIGVQEYFAYDPQDPPVWRNQGATKPRLLGWRYTETGQPVTLEPDEAGRLWSEKLELFLVPDGFFLRLLDATGKQLLTAAEAVVIEQQETSAAQRRIAELEKLVAQLQQEKQEKGNQ